MKIRDYDPDQDEPPVYTLWRRTLGTTWPLSQAAFHHTTVESGVYRSGDHLVAEAEGRIVGFVATQTRSVPGEAHARGELMVILVEPEHQRRGVGRRLLEHAEAVLRSRGVKEAQLGAGGLSYFWAGVPTNLPDAWEFFAACGWPEVVRSFDLVRPLGDYTTPPWVYERVQQARIRIDTAEPADVPAVLAFEAAHFPKWLIHYEQIAAHRTPADIVLARDAGGAIVGTSSVLDMRAPWRRYDFVWDQLLGADTGGVGPLGVAEAQREKGTGLALAARVTELLQARGIATSFIGYTWLADWYGKLGYRVWREHRLSDKTL